MCFFVDYSTQIPELYLKQLKLEQETELLRNINREILGRWQCE